VAARRWRQFEAEKRCRDCGVPLSARRVAKGNRCCTKCGADRAHAEAQRRKRRKPIPPPAGEL